jgi:hypothetical protein
MAMGRLEAATVASVSRLGSAATGAVLVARAVPDERCWSTRAVVVMEAGGFDTKS